MLFPTTGNAKKVYEQGVLKNHPEVDFIKAKSWTQSHFTLYAKLLRSFLRPKSLVQSVRAWPRAYMGL